MPAAKSASREPDELYLGQLGGTEFLLIFWYPL